MDKKYIVDLNNINLHELDEVISINRDVDVGIHIPQDVIGKGAEFTNIRNRENIELSNLWTKLNKLMNNLYIQSADKEGLIAYKKLIDDESIKGDLESQRKQIYSLWNMLRIWTHRTLISWLDDYIGKSNYRLRLAYNEYHIYFEIFLKKGSKYDGKLYKKLREIIPANLLISFRLYILDELVIKDKTDTYTNPFYPVGHHHRCGTIFKHQYTGKKVNSNIKIPNKTNVRGQRVWNVNEPKTGHTRGGKK